MSCILVELCTRLRVCSIRVLLAGNHSCGLQPYQQRKRSVCDTVGTNKIFMHVVDLFDH